MLPYPERYHFIVETDHQSLKWLLRQSNPRGRLSCWIMSLQPYDFEMVYRKGVLNQVADVDTAEVAARSMARGTPYGQAELKSRVPNAEETLLSPP